MVDIEKISNALAVNLGMSAADRITNRCCADNRLTLEPIVISTDPPYYDNIGYADLSDFFYVWLKTIACSVFGRICFGAWSHPKTRNWLQRHIGMVARTQAEAFFMKGMGEALTAMRKAATRDEPLAIYYAFKQSKLLRTALRRPVGRRFCKRLLMRAWRSMALGRCELNWQRRFVGKDANALASSIVLVCRKRAADCGRNHARRLHPCAQARTAGCHRRDSQGGCRPGRHAAIGDRPRHGRVLALCQGAGRRRQRHDGEDRARRSSTASGKRSRTSSTPAFDAETQVALAWFATYGFDAQRVRRTDHARQRQEHPDRTRCLPPACSRT